MNMVSYQQGLFHLTDLHNIEIRNLDPNNSHTYYTLGLNVYINPTIGSIDALSRDIHRRIENLKSSTDSEIEEYSDDDFQSTVTVNYYSINFGFLNSDVSQLQIVIDDNHFVPVKPMNISRTHDRGYIQNTYAEEFTESFQFHIEVKDLKRICNSNNSSLQVNTSGVINIIPLNEDFKFSLSKLINLSLDSSFREEYLMGRQSVPEQEECYVYLMVDSVNSYHKIGISKMPEWRERTLQSEKPSIELVASKRFVSKRIASSFERALHSAYSQKRIRGEWFQLDTFELQEIIQTLKD